MPSVSHRRDLVGGDGGLLKLPVGGLGPAPRRTGPTWSQFLRAHARAVLACDFLTVDSIRLGVLSVLVFLEISSRRVIFCNATAHPTSAWVAQQARKMAWELEGLKIPIKVLIRDRDSKYSSDFDAVFSAAGIRIARKDRDERGGQMAEIVRSNDISRPTMFGVSDKTSGAAE